MAEHHMSTPPRAQRDLWRAGCVDEAHVRFGGRFWETDRWKHRHRAPSRPHHLKVRLEADKLCLLVIIGVRADGRKELVALADGFRESSESWADLDQRVSRRLLITFLLILVSASFDKLAFDQWRRHEPGRPEWGAFAIRHRLCCGCAPAEIAVAVGASEVLRVFTARTSEK